MEIPDFERLVKPASQRVMRYYSCAVAGLVKDLGRTQAIVKAIAFGEQMAAGTMSWSRHYEIRKLAENLKTLAARQDNFQRRVSREVALLCVDQTITKSHFLAVMNAVRGFMGRGFDDDIACCIRPEYDRKSIGTRNQDIRAMARKMYEEEDYAVGLVLADACEEADILTQEAWDHLRKDCHWRGCWVLEDLLGMWGQ